MTRSRTAGPGTDDPADDPVNRGIFDEPAATASAEPRDAAPGGPPPASFELAMAELESLVERMEGGRLPLEESLAAYQRGVVLVKYCREALGQVAQRVRILEADLLQPFDAAADDRDA
jgi:exodeoxyribonuclease VII small subunit